MRTLLRATLSLSMLRGLAISIFSARCTSSETTNDALWTMCRLCTRPYHLGKQIDIIIRFTRHFFTNRVQDF
ncbi:MAG TPA: hypothetical protein VGP98_03910 [Pyrinomonadaceae bacterium]|nr:hypothetical protein [Pyrinomonadaceae bacterium]